MLSGSLDVAVPWPSRGYNLLPDIPIRQRCGIKGDKDPDTRRLVLPSLAITAIYNQSTCVVPFSSPSLHLVKELSIIRHALLNNYRVVVGLDRCLCSSIGKFPC